MNTRRTYLGKTASQWLAQAEICESRAGRKEIFVKNGMTARYHPDGILLETGAGLETCLELSPAANRRFCEMCELRDAND